MTKRKTPYDREPLHRRCSLWIKHMPLAYARALFAIAGWAIRGAEPVDMGELDNPMIGRWELSRAETAAHIWRCYVSTAQMRMGCYYTLAEVIADLKDEATK